MKEFEYLVKDNIGNTLGVFDLIDNAISFVKSLYETYYNEEYLKITIVRQESVNLCHQNLNK